MKKKPSELPKSLPIQDIILDPRTQQRMREDPERIDEYREVLAGGGQLPPAKVCIDRGGKAWCWDGHHTIRAALAAGLTSYPVEASEGSLRDAILLSCSANATHGLPRSVADKRRAVTTVLSDPKWSQWTNRKIAEICSVSHPFVAKVRADLGIGEAGASKPPRHVEPTPEAPTKAPPIRIVRDTDQDLRDEEPTYAVSDEEEEVAPAPDPVPEPRAPAPPPPRGDAAPPARIEPLRDAVGRVIPAPLVPVMQALPPALRRAQKLVSDAAAEIELALESLRRSGAALPGDPLGALPATLRPESLRTLARQLAAAAPHTSCPYCGGEGCSTCGTSGWASRATFEAAPPDAQGTRSAS